MAASHGDAYIGVFRAFVDAEVTATQILQSAQRAEYEECRDIGLGIYLCLVLGELCTAWHRLLGGMETTTDDYILGSYTVPNFAERYRIVSESESVEHVLHLGLTESALPIHETMRHFLAELIRILNICIGTLNSDLSAPLKAARVRETCDTGISLLALTWHLQAVALTQVHALPPASWPTCQQKFRSGIPC